MGILQNILNRTGYYNEKQLQTQVSEALKKELEKVPGWLGDTAESQKWNMPDPQIFANQADLYRLSHILGTALDILAGDVGTANFNVKRMIGEEERDIPNHEFELKLRTPNPLDSGLELMSYTVSNYQLNGNSVWWLNKVDKYAPVDEIWTIPFSMIKPIPDKQLYIKWYEYYPGDGRTLTFETWEIVHFKTYNPNNRFVGLSKLESLAVTIHGDLEMRETNTRNYAEYGGAPQSILAFKDYPSNETWNDIKAEKRQAAKRNEMMMLRGVGDGITWMQRALSNKDMDFVNNLKQNMTDVFNRMCPGLLSMLSESATEANAMAARATYSEKTLWVQMEVIAQKITSDILPVYGRKLKGEFDDPRVVDRKLQLEEQAVFERSHTLAEVRQEYYQDEPLGDERDNLLVSQIKADSAAPEQPQEQPATTPPAESQQIETEADNSMQDALKADLMRWKRVALRTFGKTQKPFDSDVIPEDVKKYIEAKLPACKSVGEVADLFEHYKPVNKMDSIRYLADVINRTVNAQ